MPRESRGNAGVTADEVGDPRAAALASSRVPGDGDGAVQSLAEWREVSDGIKHTSGRVSRLEMGC